MPAYIGIDDELGLIQLKKIAMRSCTGKYAMGSYIMRGLTLLSNGWSHIPNNENRKHWSLHAEMHALARGRNHRTLSGSVCWIAAVSRKSGKFTVAKPCLDCAIALNAAGVEYVCYTTPDTNTVGLMRMEKILPMLSSLKVYTGYSVNE